MRSRPWMDPPRASSANVIPARRGPEGSSPEQAGTQFTSKRDLARELCQRASATPIVPTDGDLRCDWVPTLSRLLASLTSGVGMTVRGMHPVLPRTVRLTPGDPHEVEGALAARIGWTAGYARLGLLGAGQATGDG